MAVTLKNLKDLEAAIRYKLADNPSRANIILTVDNKRKHSWLVLNKKVGFVETVTLFEAKNNLPGRAKMYTYLKGMRMALEISNG